MTAHTVSAAGRIQQNLKYCTTPDGVDLLMDVYTPDHGNAPFPAVLYVHGGSWVSGSKAEGGLIPGRTDLVRGGNLFISINYRLAPQHKFPAQIEDVKCAVRWLRAHAAELNLDPDRIAAMGSSAGGHLVALLGTSGPEAGWDEMGGYTDQSSRVKAVVDLFGPAAPTGDITGSDLDLLREVFGADGLSDPILQQASPVTYISPGDPPFLIIHGTLDRTVPLAQSQLLEKQLKTGGVPAKLVVVEGAGHGLPTPGSKTNPSFQEVMELIRDFLTEAIG